MRSAMAVLAAGCLTVSFGAAADAQEAAPPPDICLAVGLDPVDVATMRAITDAVGDALATRPVLIPAPHLVESVAEGTTGDGGVVRVPIWTDVPDGAIGPASADDLEAACGLDRTGGAWSATISGEFLRAGTKRELAAAGTTPGFTSDIDVEWDEAADLVRTVLTFSGPLGIPNGTCWMDDVVSADGIGGTHAETTTDSVTSPFGDGVCGRFEQYLANGGAGAQALVLLPRVIPSPDGSELRLDVDGVDVRADGIHLWGGVQAGLS